MGNRPLYKIERIHMLGTPESEGLKVAALNLFHPTASPPLQHVSFFIVTQSLKRGEGELLHIDCNRQSMTGVHSIMRPLI